METIDANGNIFPTQKNKEGFRYFYFIEYYPTRFNVSQEYHERRKHVWSFKNGENSIENANIIRNYVEHLSLSKPLYEWWLCIIPASTKLKTKKRFEGYCEYFCHNNSINNGFDLIQNREDRNTLHESDTRNYDQFLQSLSFGDVKGKKILLFDDIYTSGKSFIIVAKKLTFLGADQVVGLFLGKTHRIDPII